MWPWKDTIIKSKINGGIRVRHSLGRPAVWVEGFEQSGPMVERLWRTGLKNLPQTSPKNILILGLGCGVVAKLLRQKYTAAKITGVEIDPVMIRLGKKYFDLDRVANTKIVCRDAFGFVYSLQGKFDMIIVDLYSGHSLPAQVQSEEFLRNLKRLISKDGKIMFNHLDYGVKAAEKKEFHKVLTRNFLRLESFKTEYNTVFLVS